MSKLTVEEYGLKPVKGEIGIEIEMEGKHLPAVVDGWNAVVDGSLRGDSMEYVVGIPIMRHKVASMLQGLQNDLKANKAVLDPSDRCGVHIHVNCQDLSAKQVINFAVTYLVLEDLLVKFCGEDREGNLFCLRSKDAEYLITLLSRAVRAGTLKGMQSDQVRYASINFSSLKKYGSLEFRSMHTPKDFSIITTWVEMLLNVKDASLKFTEPYEIVEYMSAQGAERFLREVMKGYTEILSCSGMEGLLMDAVRRVQPVAYASRIQKKDNVAPPRKLNAAKHRLDEVERPEDDDDFDEWCAYWNDHRQELLNMYHVHLAYKAKGYAKLQDPDYTPADGALIKVFEQIFNTPFPGLYIKPPLEREPGMWGQIQEAARVDFVDDPDPINNVQEAIPQVAIDEARNFWGADVGMDAPPVIKRGRPIPNPNARQWGAGNPFNRPAVIGKARPKKIGE